MQSSWNFGLRVCFFLVFGVDGVGSWVGCVVFMLTMLSSCLFGGQRAGMRVVPAKRHNFGVAECPCFGNMGVAWLERVVSPSIVVGFVMLVVCGWDL